MNDDLKMMEVVRTSQGLEWWDEERCIHRKVNPRPLPTAPAEVFGSAEMLYLYTANDDVSNPMVLATNMPVAVERSNKYVAVLETVVEIDRGEPERIWDLLHAHARMLGCGA